MKRQAKSG